MQRILFVLTLIGALMLAGCGETESGTAPVESTHTTTPTNITPTETTTPLTSQPTVQIPEVYTQLLDKYAAALSERANGGALTAQDLNYMMADCYGQAPLERIGYAIVDIDEDGIPELIVGTTSVIDDEFYAKLIFDMYTLDGTGTCIKICTSTERDRYYYAGGNRIANTGSAGADYDYVTTLKLQNGELLDMTFTTDPKDYVQMELEAFHNEK